MLAAFNCSFHRSSHPPADTTFYSHHDEAILEPLKTKTQLLITELPKSKDHSVHLVDEYEASDQTNGWSLLLLCFYLEPSLFPPWSQPVSTTIAHTITEEDTLVEPIGHCQTQCDTHALARSELLSQDGEWDLYCLLIWPGSQYSWVPTVMEKEDAQRGGVFPPQFSFCDEMCARGLQQPWAGSLAAQDWPFPSLFSLMEFVNLSYQSWHRYTTISRGRYFNPEKKANQRQIREMGSSGLEPFLGNGGIGQPASSISLCILIFCSWLECQTYSTVITSLFFLRWDTSRKGFN